MVRVEWYVLAWLGTMAVLWLWFAIAWFSARVAASGKAGQHLASLFVVSSAGFAPLLILSDAGIDSGDGLGAAALALIFGWCVPGGLGVLFVVVGSGAATSNGTKGVTMRGARRRQRPLRELWNPDAGGGGFGAYVGLVDLLLGLMPDPATEQFVAGPRFERYRTVATAPDEADREQRADFAAMVDELLAEHLAQPALLQVDDVALGLYEREARAALGASGRLRFPDRVRQARR